MTMTPDAKRALATTIRGLRARLLADLRASTESAYRLSAKAHLAGLDDATRRRRDGLEAWAEEQRDEATRPARFSPGPALLLPSVPSCHSERDTGFEPATLSLGS
jgi:hypothetical protein